jgi:hypothetical protein
MTEDHKAEVEAFIRKNLLFLCKASLSKLFV